MEGSHWKRGKEEKDNSVPISLKCRYDPSQEGGSVQCTHLSPGGSKHGKIKKASGTQSKDHLL
jgi:hypothetical protein